MYCKKCGKENEDSAKICTECGCSLVVEAAEKGKRKISIWSLVGMGLGIVIIFFGIMNIIDMPVSSLKPEHMQFGADFYTESYKAIRYAAMNIGSAAEAIVRGLGYVTTSIGIFMTVYFGKSAFEK